MPRRNNRSPEAQAYRKLYHTARWQKRRLAQLSSQPLCEWCMKRGIVKPASVAHHATPHRGDEVLFFDLPLVSLCHDCHDIEAQGIEARGFSKEVDVTGWPVSPTHPANKI